MRRLICLLTRSSGIEDQICRQRCCVNPQNARRSFFASVEHIRDLRMLAGQEPDHLVERATPVAAPL